MIYYYLEGNERCAYYEGYEVHGHTRFIRSYGWNAILIFSDGATKKVHTDMECTATRAARILHERYNKAVRIKLFLIEKSGEMYYPKNDEALSYTGY